MTKVTDSQELAVPVRSSLDLVSLNELAQLMRSNERVEVVDDPEQIAREIFEQILGAESTEELNQFGKAEGWRELEGVMVKLGADFKWRPSTYTEGAAVFLVVPGEKVMPEGQLEPAILTTGSRNVIAQLMNLAARRVYKGALVELVRSEKPTKRGFYPLWLRIHQEGGEKAESPAAVGGDGAAPEAA